MAQTPTKLSDTARAMLTLAATREDHLVRPPQLPPAAARQVVRSLLNNGLVEEVSAPIEDAAYAWRTGEDATALILRVTEAGLAAIGEAPALEAASPDQTVDVFTQHQTVDAFSQQVTEFLYDRGWERLAASEDEAKTMIEDGLANGRSAVLVAGDIIAWLEEREAEQDDAGEAETTPATAPRLPDPGASDDVSPTKETATESPIAPNTGASGDTAPTVATSTADARPDAPQAPPRPSLRHAAQAVLAAWSDEATRAATLEGAMDALRLALGERAPRPAPRSYHPTPAARDHQAGADAGHAAPRGGRHGGADR
jgi:hypothetical protein